MKDYNLYQVSKILQETNINNVQIRRHVLDNYFDRNYTLEDIENSFNNKIPVSITKENYDKFKILYEFKENEDLCIIISVSDYEDVEIITVYLENKNKRVRP